jgi:hypothetical protein
VANVEGDTVERPDNVACVTAERLVDITAAEDR